MEKLKIKHLNKVFRVLRFFGILKISSVRENICYTVSAIMVKHANIFRKCFLTCGFNFAFLLFKLIQMK